MGQFSTKIFLIATAVSLSLLSCSTNEPADQGETPEPVDDRYPNSQPEPATIPDGFTLALREVVSGLDLPVALASPPGDSRLFIVEVSGVITIVQNGQHNATPFLDIRSLVKSGNEQGLLGLAFHPNYSTNGFFYVAYTTDDNGTRIVRYSRSSDPNRADANSAVPVMTIDRQRSFHNGGNLVFAPDGMLLIGLGDGGIDANAQDNTAILGGMLRINVNGSPYSIPANNPYVNHPTNAPEIWAKGLRNPWRYSVDRITGLLYIGDVGHARQEEVDVVPVGASGLNYGWSITEGPECFEQSSCNRQGLTEPAVTYDHDAGCSVTGGFVYRGYAIPEVLGRYFYADYCQGWIRSFRFRNGDAEEQRDWEIPNVGAILTWGEDASGELYVTTLQGSVYRLVKGN